MRVAYHRLARAEVARTAARFQRDSAAKRVRFLTALDVAIARVCANPGVGSPAFGQYRWVRVGRFKYLLYYGLTAPDELEIWAVAHASRRPGYWLRRTRHP